jgi:hypothetical protein
VITRGGARLAVISASRAQIPHRDAIYANFLTPGPHWQQVADVLRGAEPELIAEWKHKQEATAAAAEAEAKLRRADEPRRIDHMPDALAPELLAACLDASRRIRLEPQVAYERPVILEFHAGKLTLLPIAGTGTRLLLPFRLSRRQRPWKGNFSSARSIPCRSSSGRMSLTRTRLPLGHARSSVSPTRRVSRSSRSSTQSRATGDGRGGQPPPRPAGSPRRRSFRKAAMAQPPRTGRPPGPVQRLVRSGSQAAPSRRPDSQRRSPRPGAPSRDRPPPERDMGSTARPRRPGGYRDAILVALTGRTGDSPAHRQPPALMPAIANVTSVSAGYQGTEQGSGTAIRSAET